MNNKRIKGEQELALEGTSLPSNQNEFYFKHISIPGTDIEIIKHKDGCNCYIGPMPTYLITRATDKEIVAWAQSNNAIIEV